MKGAPSHLRADQSHPQGSREDPKRYLCFLRSHEIVVVDQHYPDLALSEFDALSQSWPARWFGDTPKQSDPHPNTESPVLPQAPEELSTPNTSAGSVRKARALGSEAHWQTHWPSGPVPDQLPQSVPPQPPDAKRLAEPPLPHRRHPIPLQQTAAP